jgi:cardiolipin synthase
VTTLAKWKTTAQLVAVGFLLAGVAGDALVTSIVKVPGLYVTNVGLGLLWLSALVTLYTGYDYFKAGVRHLMD